MSEYIEREAATKVLCDACGNAACPKGTIPRCSYYEQMQSLPAADVRTVVLGRWKDGGKSTFFPDDKIYRCSECDSSYFTTFRFCPNCRSDMREGGDSDG